jgi:two-component system cell cycle sensor histidine kinase PleC
LTTGVDFWTAASVAVGAIAVAVWLWCRLNALAGSHRRSAEEIERLRSFIAVSSDWTWEQDDQFRFT